MQRIGSITLRRVWSYDDAAAKHQTAGTQSMAAVQAAIHKHQARTS